MAALVLEYLKVLLSTPPVTGLVLIVFMVLFRKPLRKLIGRTQGVKFPGGEWSASQVQRAAEAEAATSPELPEPVEVSAETPPAGLTLTPEDQDRLADFVKAERARAAYWEYRYLNLYLVPHTQAVLDWIAARPNRITLQLYDALWRGTILNPEERNAVLGALLDYHLLQAKGNLLEVTPKGREYLDFRGPLMSNSAPNDDDEASATS